MQIKYILSFLAFGAVLVFSEGSHITKREINPFDVLNHVNILKQDLVEIAEKTYTLFNKMVKDMENRKTKRDETLSTTLQGTSSTFKNKLKQELTEAKANGSGADAEKIESCVVKEYTRYGKEFGESYVNSLKCIMKATETGKTAVHNAKKTFEESRNKSKDITDKLNQECMKPQNSICIKIHARNYSRSVTTADTVSIETMQWAEDYNRKHEKDTEVCLKNFQTQTKDIEENHKFYLGECVDNPEGPLWTYNWSL